MPDNLYGFSLSGHQKNCGCNAYTFPVGSSPGAIFHMLQSALLQGFN